LLDLSSDTTHEGGVLLIVTVDVKELDSTGRGGDTGVSVHDEKLTDFLL